MSGTTRCWSSSTSPRTCWTHIEADIKAAEKELDDDAESIITNERYVYIAYVIKACYKKKNAGKLSVSDKIDRVVTNRWLGLPIFAVVMFLVYYISMVTVGAARDGLGQRRPVRRRLASVRHRHRPRMRKRRENYGDADADASTRSWREIRHRARLPPRWIPKQMIDRSDAAEAAAPLRLRSTQLSTKRE